MAPDLTTETSDLNTSNDPSLKPSNPKDVIGSDKIPYHLWPEIASAMGALGLLDGALKYGRGNFREFGVRYTIYLDALRRHAGALLEGEDTDPDSQLHHLCHVLACAGILADALANDTLTDDRNYNPHNGYRQMLNKLTDHVPRLKALHAHRNPKHWTIKDLFTRKETR